MGITCLKFDATPPKVFGVPGALMDSHLTRKGLSRLVRSIEDIRREVGEEVEISVEARCGTLANAMRYLKAVEPFDLTWVEDPIPPTDVEAWATLTASSHTPTLVGEGLHLRHEFLEFFRRSATRLVAPDIQICGGIAEAKKIADLADIHHLLTCPHNASSPIGIAAAVHSCAAMPNLLALEFHAMPGWDRILKGYRPQISDGFIDIPEGPGLGVELDEEETRKYLMEGETLVLCFQMELTPQPRDFPNQCVQRGVPRAGLDRLERTAAAGSGNKDRNIDRQDKQDRLVLHPVHPVYRCKTRIEGWTWIADEGC